MYRGFNLDFNWENVHWRTEEYFNYGQAISTSNKLRVKNKIESFISNNGIIDGAKMESDWFPLIQADVFISHSHADETEAICLAGYLGQVLGIKSFVDSCIWGNADVLLKSIDDDKCFDQAKGVYDYNKRNYSTSHVHMMLSAALLKMIDKTECLFFLKTPNSAAATTSKIISETESPWIYCELLISSLVRKRSLADHRPELMKAKSFSEGGTLNENLFSIRHKINTGHLQDIDEVTLGIWAVTYGYSLHEKYALDGLYEMF